MLNINFPKIDKKTFNDLEISLAEEKIKINIRGKSKDFFTKVGNYTICNGCRMPLHNKEKKSPKFKIGLSCPKCYDNLTKDQFKRFTMRHQQIVKSKNNYKFKKNIIR